MEHDDEDSNTSLQPRPEGILKKKMGTDISTFDFSAKKAGFQNEVDVAELQEMVCMKMHKAMSPISAISGYLELMKMLLEKDASSESLECYRKKVEEGVGEISDIVEDLHTVFDDMKQERNNALVQSKGISSDKSRRAS